MSSHHPMFLKVGSFLFSTILSAGLVYAVIPTLGGFDQPASPATVQAGPDFIVNDPADPGDPACTVTSCSLRAAITAANTGSLTGTQAIAFSLTYPVTITLSSPLPVITGTVIISGPGSANLSVSGGGAFRVFEVGNGASLDVTAITIHQGYDDLRGGGILVDHGRLSLLDSLLLGNFAGAGDGGGLHNDGGRVTVVNTTFDENGAFHDGAITNNGVMTVTESLFNDNHARIGGAINNSGALTVTNSTFTLNIGQPISGGAIQNGGNLVVANSTFFKNGGPTGADIQNDNGSVHVTNSTFYSATLPSMNSIVSDGISATMTLSNSILAAGPGIDNCAVLGGGAVNVSADSLTSDGTCAGATMVALNQLQLGPLQDNGGSTPTFALLPGSVAIDAGDDPVCAAPIGASTYGAGGVDQRGVARPQGTHCDVGAYEQFPSGTLYLPVIIID